MGNRWRANLKDGRMVTVYGVEREQLLSLSINGQMLILNESASGDLVGLVCGPASEYDLAAFIARLYNVLAPDVEAYLQQVEEASNDQTS